MKLEFSEPSRSYSSGSQSARVATEAWVANSIYCPNCGHPSLSQFPANLPVADFYCLKCKDQFELKSQKKAFGRKIANGAYDVKVTRLQSDTSPNLILMRYDSVTASVIQLCIIPKRFFTPSTIERRKPLSQSACRAGWVGSNIILERIPSIGRISIVQDGAISDKEAVLTQWQQTAFLETEPAATRGWLVDVMTCIDRIGSSQFSLSEMYEFAPYLSQLYPNNKHVRAKIRQQLQILRDNGYLDFTGGGSYRITRD